MDGQRFTLDLENIIKAIIIPAVIAAVLAVANWIDFDLGVFFTLLLTGMSAFSGAYYLRSLNMSGKTYQLVNAGLNGGIVAGLAMVIFRLLNWFLLSIRYSDWSTSIGWTIAYVIEAAFIGLIGALAWQAYQRDKQSRGA
jgi:hypothetical protein